MTKYFLAITVFFVSFFSNFAFAKDHFTTESEDISCARDIGLQIDQYFSPVVGSDAMITLLRGYQALDDALIPSTAGDSSASMILGRLGKFLLIEGTFMGAQRVTQHEIFGHGFRAREFHVPVYNYRITPWSGATSLNGAKFAQLSLNEQAAINTGGMEADTILAKEIRNRWLDNQIIDSREAHLYFKSYLDQTGYVLSTKQYRDKIFSDGHDVINYINNINQWHQRPVLSTHKLRRQVLIDFLDPYLFYSIYSMGDYIFEGCQSFEYPMIQIGDYQYLPAMRLILAPYGTEYQLNNLIRGSQHNIQAALRYGNTGGRRSTGLTLEVTRLLSSDLLVIDGRADVWNQPKMFAATSTTAKSHFGGALSLIARYRIAQRVDLKGQAGYKTTGYIPGEVLKHSPILRIGFTAYF